MVFLASVTILKSQVEVEGHSSLARSAVLVLGFTLSETTAQAMPLHDGS